MMDPGKIILNVQRLRVGFRTKLGVVQAVDGVSLYVKKGETVGLVGESGCGKTMTALSLTRLTPKTAIIEAEKMLLGGNDILRLEEANLREIRGKNIAYVFQDPMTFLNPVMKIYDQIAAPMKRHGAGDRLTIREKVIRLLNDVQIADSERVCESFPHQLSGGMNQRVLLAIALSCNPSLLIADEPTTALDVTVQAVVLDLLKKLKNKYSLSTLLITHDLGIVGEICDRVYIMYAGKIMETGDIFQIYGNPLHPYTSGLLKSVKSVTHGEESLFSIQGTVPNPMEPPPGCRFHPRCERAQGACSEKEPPLHEMGKERRVACWLFEEKR